MEIENIQIKNDASKKCLQLNSLAPKLPCRVLLIGRSGSGKTTNLVNLVMKYLPWDTLAVYARHLEEDPKYEVLRRAVEKQEEKTGKCVSIFSDKISDLLPLDKYNEDNNNLVVFDDWLTLSSKENQPIIDYFVRGRHKNVSSIYASQQYHKIPKTIRQQATHLILYKGLAGRDIEDAYNDNITVMDKKSFIQFYKDATKEPYSFIVIDNTTPELHLRKGWDEIYIPDDE